MCEPCLLGRVTFHNSENGFCVLRVKARGQRDLTLAFDSGPPLVRDEPAATYERASNEHGRLSISGATNRLRIGDKIRLVPRHCDPTINLCDWYVAIRGNRVEQLWPITARGVVY